MIQGSNVFFKESSNYVINKSIQINGTDVKIKFSRQLLPYTEQDGVNLTDCLQDSSGVIIYLFNGSLTSSGDISFNKASRSKPVGPFCFSSCASKPNTIEEANNEITIDIQINDSGANARKFELNREFDEETVVLMESTDISMIPRTNQELTTESYSTMILDAQNSTNANVSITATVSSLPTTHKSLIPVINTTCPEAVYLLINSSSTNLSLANKYDYSNDFVIFSAALFDTQMLPSRFSFYITSNNVINLK